jgi:acyl dehydratase
VTVTHEHAAPALIPPVGTAARRSRTVRAEDISLFTEITGDQNPLHYDEALAAASRFGGIIVQGGVTSGLFNAVVAEDLPGPGTVFLQVSWAFRAPARPGDTITAEVEVLGRRDDKPIATLRTTITNQRGEVLVDGTAVVYRERTVAESASGRLGPWVGGSGSRQG